MIDEENKENVDSEKETPEVLDVPIEEATSEDIKGLSFDSEELRKAIHAHDTKKLDDFFAKIPDADIAKACEDLEITELITLFRDTKSKNNASLYDELSHDLKEALVRAMTNKELVDIINEQSVDDVADTVGDMPANLARKVLLAADPKMRSDINQLLKYKDDTAGAIMTTEFLEFKESETVKKVIQEIRRIGREAETVYTIFCRNAKRKFVGTVDLDDLIWAEENTKLSEIMNKDAPYCHVNTDKEDVGNMFRKYDLNAMAVLNTDDCLLGIVTVDDAVDVLAAESAEDMARMTNMTPTEKPYMEMSIWENARKCFPWIIILLVLGTFTTMVLNRLEVQNIFVHLPILISFVPTLMDTGGNAGGQTTGMMIRSLATNEFDSKATLKVLWKELRSAFVVALFVASFAFFWVMLEQYTGIVSLGNVGDPGGVNYDFSSYNVFTGQVFNGELAKEFAVHSLIFAGLVSLTMFVAITFSKLVGTLLCMMASALRKDPAMLAQPMLTTIMDVATLLIYFTMACIFFPYFA